MDSRRELLVVVGVSTAIGFAAEIILHSMEESRGKKFQFHFPDRMRALELFAATLVTGLAVDYAIKYTDKRTMSEQEHELADLYSKEKIKVIEGVRKGLKPLEVLWKPYASLDNVAETKQLAKS